MFGITKNKTLSATPKKVLVLIDWDNLFLCLHNRFARQMRIEYRIQKLLKWVQKEIGEIFEGYGFVFAPEHLSTIHQDMCTDNNLRLFTCPKRQLDKPKKNLKTNKMVTEEDTVDETLMWFGKIMMSHSNVGFICLVAGDDDYVPLMKEAKKQNIQRVLIPPTLDSLSRSKRLVRLADKHPITKEKMILRLDTL